jgi:hypothetical protein
LDAATGSSGQGNLSYSWVASNGGNITLGSDTATPTVDAAGTYTVTVTDDDNGCTASDFVVITVDNTLPETPAICVIQPSLCGPSTGSITILSPIGDSGKYAYSIDNGAHYTQDKTFWDNLAAGSVSGIKVKNLNTGCESSAADCSASDCSAPVAKIQEVEELIEPEKVYKQETIVKAFPNPFRNTINFVVEVTEPGLGSLELMNMQGEKVKTVFVGKFNTGKNTYEVNLPSHQPTTLIYILRIGNKRSTGKLIQM